MFKARRVLVALFGCLCIAAFACGDDDVDLDKVIEEAQVCSAEDTCVLAGAGQCTCDWPVNSAQVDRVEDAVASHDCGSATVKCGTYSNVRCENGKCVADPDQ